MIDKLTENNVKQLAPDEDNNSAVLFYQFQYNTIMEASSKLMQFSLAFFSVSSLLTGFVAFNNLDSRIKVIVYTCITIMVVVFGVIGASIMYGVITGLNQIRANFKKISLSTYDKLEMDSYFRRGITVLYIVSAVSLTGVAAIMFVIFKYL